MSDFLAVAEELKRHSSFLITGHVHPEGDCAGSVLGMESLLKRLGKKTQILCDSPLPNMLRFLDKGSWRVAAPNETAPLTDAVVAVDTPNWDRLGAVAPLLKDRRVINIDHHISNTRFGAVNWVEPSASACGEMVYRLFEHFGLALEREEARILYTAISTDTGSFRYSNTQPDTHRIVAGLLETGLDVEKINQDIYGNYPETRLKLIGEMLARRQSAFEGRLQYSVLPQEVLKATGGSAEELEGAIDFLRGVKGVKACFVITEWIKGISKVSFRSSSDLDVNQAAKTLGGGGHRKASGATLKTTPVEACQRVLEALKPFFL